MDSLEQRRRKNTRKLIQDRELSPGDFARKIDRSQSYVSQLISEVNPCRFGEKMARHIEQCFKLKAGYLDETNKKIDLSTLYIVISKVETALNKRGLTLEAKDKTELIGLLYELKTSNEPPSDYHLRKIINDYIT